MSSKNYCPLIKDDCREDCVFSCRQVTTSQGYTSCLIVSKLDDVNEMQRDQLSEIYQAIEMIEN